MKKLLILFLIITLSFGIVSCSKDEVKDETENTENSGNNNNSAENENNTNENNYPEGAIVLTKENFTDYFDIKVLTDIAYDYNFNNTKASSYVSFVPKNTYAEAVGEVKFNLNAKVYQYSYSSSFNISMLENSLLLKAASIPNKTFNAYYPGGGDVSYKVISGSDNITVNSVYGYVIPKEKEPNTYEKLTDEQKAASESIKNEAVLKTGTFAINFSGSESYELQVSTDYNFGSIYGNDLSAKGNSGTHPIKVDLKNEFIENANGKYFCIGDIVCLQSVNNFGLVEVEKTGFDLESLLASATPVFDIFDDSAVYLKESDTYYVAYTTLTKMQSEVWKEAFIYLLSAYGIESDYDKFVVKYEYSFADGNLSFAVNVEHNDFQYPGHYAFIKASCRQKISGLNNSSVSLYTDDEKTFALANNKENAMLFKTGLVEINGNTTEIVFKTFSDENEGYGNTYYENWLPIHITEPGVYSFIPSVKSINVYDANGNSYGIYENNNYYTAGIYYIKCNSVVYGLTEVTLTVESIILDDFGDINSPVKIENNSFNCYLEANGDRQVFSFTPTDSGLYDFGEHQYVNISVYAANNLEEELDYAWPPKHCLILNADVEYVLVFECVNYGSNTEHFTYSGEIKYLGVPNTDSEFTVTEEWQDIFLFANTNKKFTVEITNPGVYYIEFELTDGQNITYAHFYTLDDESLDAMGETIETENGEIYLQPLDIGSYSCHAPLYQDYYFIGKVRLVKYTEGVSESTDIEITNDGYTTLTTSNLATVYSESSFTFEVTEKSRLLITKNSDSFTLYDENGNNVGITVYPLYKDTEFDNIETKHTVLEVGTYTIVFKISKYDTTGIKSAEVRLINAEK